MTQTRLGVIVIALASAFLAATPTWAGISIGPYASISSTKKIKPEANGKEKETIKQRQNVGVRGSLSFYRIFKLQLSVGQGELTTTEKIQDAKDEYEEIDYEEDLDVSTDDPSKEIKIVDTQRKARLGIVFDPGFWIFIARAKGGVQATQRIVSVTEEGKDTVTTEPPITYKPYAGAGAGVRLGYGTYFIAEYNIFMYKFPELEPFEREVTVSFGVSI